MYLMANIFINYEYMKLVRMIVVHVLGMV
jgi:hypothetical protein